MSTNTITEAARNRESLAYMKARYPEMYRLYKLLKAATPRDRYLFTLWVLHYQPGGLLWPYHDEIEQGLQSSDTAAKDAAWARIESVLAEPLAEIMARRRLRLSDLSRQEKQRNERGDS